MSILQPEASIFYAVCWIIVIIRLISRRLHRGSWKLLQLDDYLILVAMATDTVLIACMFEVVKTNSNLIAPGDDVSHFSQDEIKGRIYGSKIVLVIEQMQISTIWLIKHWIVIATSIYAGITFVVMEILYFGVWCRPFNQYWAVPPNSKQCSAATNHLITNTVFNISSDLIILSIPLPLLFKVRLPMKNKAVLFAVFLIGAFTIVAAALNKYYSFTHPFGLEWTIWYLRESYTAILCANLPLIYPLIQRLFRLRNWNPHSGSMEGDYRGSQQPSTVFSRRAMWTDSKPQPAHVSSRGTVRRTESQEIIHRGYDGEEFDGPHFITSAIDLEDLRSPTISNPRSSATSSIATPIDWLPGENNIPGADPYHAK